MSRLMNCVDCGTEMKREVWAVCPHCGFKITEQNKSKVFAETRTQKEWFLGFLGLNAMLFLIMGLAIGMGGAKKFDLNVVLILMYGVVELGVLSSKYINYKNKIIFTFIIIFIVCIFKFA